MEAVGDLVGLMGKLNLAPPSSVLGVLERALVLVGKAKADLCDARWAVRARGLRHRSNSVACNPVQLYIGFRKPPFPRPCPSWRFTLGTLPTGSATTPRVAPVPAS